MLFKSDDVVMLSTSRVVHMLQNNTRSTNSTQMGVSGYPPNSMCIKRLPIGDI